jgi:hypothetical protein
LNCTSLKQRRRIEAAQDPRDIVDCRAKLIQQVIARDHFSLRKLRVSVTCVRSSADAAYNPLSRVSAKVQHEVADAV